MIDESNLSPTLRAAIGIATLGAKAPLWQGKAVTALWRRLTEDERDWYRKQIWAGQAFPGYWSAYGTADALVLVFDWMVSKEGFDFWRAICRFLHTLGDEQESTGKAACDKRHKSGDRFDLPSAEPTITGERRPEAQLTRAKVVGVHPVIRPLPSTIPTRALEPAPLLPWLGVNCPLQQEE